MSTWDTGSFDNDYALTFITELQGQENLSGIAHALDEVIVAGRTVSVDVAAVGVAAIEILAAIMGEPGDALDTNSDAADFVEELESLGTPVPPGLKARALKVLTLVINPDSELRQYWEECHDVPEWLRNIHDLRARIESV